MGRPELAEQEEGEAAILQEFLPTPLGEDEVRALVRSLIEGGIAQIGPLMGALVPRTRGRFDGKDLNRIAREELAR